MGAGILTVVVAGVALAVGKAHTLPGIGDNAVNELRVRDLTTHAVLVGPFSRDGWSHPGPILYWALLLPYRLFGSGPVGMYEGALLINGCSLLGAIAIARRVAGEAAMVLTTVALFVCVVGLGAAFVRDPWNPSITVFPFGLALVAAWGLSCGRFWLLPVVCLATTFCVQTHVGFVPLLAPVVIWAAATAVLTFRPGWSSVRVPVMVTIAIAVGAWLPPLIDQFFGNGNLGVSLSYFAHQSDSAGFEAAFRVVGEFFGIRPPWLFGAPAMGVNGTPSSLLRTPFPLVALVAFGCWVLFHRRFDVPTRRAWWLLAVATASAILALARTPPPIYEYRLGFLWVLGSLAGALIIGSVIAWTPLSRFEKQLCIGALALVFVISLAVVSRPKTPNAAEARRLSALLPATVREARDQGGRIDVTAIGIEGGIYQDGIVLGLENAGLHPSVADTRSFRLLFGPQRARTDPSARQFFVVTGTQVDVAARDPANRLIAVWQAERSRDRLADLEKLRSIYFAHRQLNRESRSLVKRLVRRMHIIGVFVRPDRGRSRVAARGTG